MKKKLHAELIFTIVKWNCTGDFTKVLCVSSRVYFKLNCISEIKDPFQFQSIQRNTLQSMPTATSTYFLLLNAQRSEAAYSNLGLSGSCTALPTGHFRVSLCLCFKASLSGKNDFDSIKKKLQAELIFTWKVSHLDSFWNRGTRGWLGSGLLFTICLVFMSHQARKQDSTMLHHSKGELQLRC